MDNYANFIKLYTHLVLKKQPNRNETKNINPMENIWKLDRFDNYSSHTSYTNYCKDMCKNIIDNHIDNILGAKSEILSFISNFLTNCFDLSSKSL